MRLSLLISNRVTNDDTLLITVAKRLKKIKDNRKYPII